MSQDRDRVGLAAPDDVDSRFARYRQVRDRSTAICKPLEDEDCCIQTMAEVSPPKWHLAHTTWFFETFLLQPFRKGYRVFDAQFARLFNSYYDTIGAAHPRPERGLLSRPTVRQTLDYRAHVDEQMALMVKTPDAAPGETAALAQRLELGLNHEQQHQELLLTDIKHIFGYNPLRPAYRELPLPAAEAGERPLEWVAFEGGIADVGHDGEAFAFDNERPRHAELLRPYRLASRPVTNREYIEFMADDGYGQPALWLADGWGTVNAEDWGAPLYWEERDGAWWHMTLGGLRPVDPDAPVCHVSYFEADAFARWRGTRLPTEAEWEHAAGRLAIQGNFVERDWLQPAAADGAGLAQMFGDVWEWTQSPYAPYPGFRPLEGSLGEYNGKFMCSQMVLRGGSCVTPRDHVRRTYRNFFYPRDRWQFSGIRLAEDAS